MDKDAASFLKYLAVSCLMLLAAAATFDVLVDPYLFFNSPRIAGFNARKPSVDTQERLMKAYDVIRAEPASLVLGSSRMDLGLSAQSPRWPGMSLPVYNLSFYAGSPYVSHRYLQHLMVHRSPSLILLGVDFQFFLRDYEIGGGPEFEARLAVKPNGQPNESISQQQIRDLHHALSLDALLDSMETLAANQGERSSDIRAGNWIREEAPAEVDNYLLFEENELALLLEYRGKRINPEAMNEVRAILNLCATRGTRVILIINPMHSTELEIVHLLGLWPVYEDWKRQLVTLASEHGSAGRVPLWDFTGYDEYSTEAVPRGSHRMHWFLNSNHYTRALGNVMLESLFSHPVRGFGAVLTPENVEQHLEEVRQRRLLYVASAPADLANLRIMFNIVNKPISVKLADAK